MFDCLPIPNSQQLNLPAMRFVLYFVVHLGLCQFCTLVQACDVVDLHAIQSLFENHCQDCHSGPKPSGDFSIETLKPSRELLESSSFNSQDWERIVRKLRAGQMPPPGSDRPNDVDYAKATHAIQKWLDEGSNLHPYAGHIDTLRRMTRSEYQNAVRDLLALDMDADALLPKDESSQGFDNITVGELSPTLLNRYLTAAQMISRIALGRDGLGPMGLNVRVPADRTQESHVEGLPLGTRGGVLIEHTFPKDGIYEIELRLARDRDERVEGLTQQHWIDLLIDRERRHRFTIKPPPNREDFTHVDSHLKTRIDV
ncbi:MAG TPA: DUF1587 domain-containing protein, partial [Pirellula sp.]|nr:DUF1587 domain-containing protein [Pirellula sp.]